MDKNNIFKMAAAAILNFICCLYLVYYDTYLHEIWHVYCSGGPTCRYIKTLNKNLIQDGGGSNLGFLHKQQYFGHRLTYMNEILQ